MLIALARTDCVYPSFLTDRSVMFKGTLLGVLPIRDLPLMLNQF